MAGKGRGGGCPEVLLHLLHTEIRAAMVLSRKGNSWHESWSHLSLKGSGVVAWGHSAASSKGRDEPLALQTHTLNRHHSTLQSIQFVHTDTHLHIPGTQQQL